MTNETEQLRRMVEARERATKGPWYAYEGKVRLESQLDGPEIASTWGQTDATKSWGGANEISDACFIALSGTLDLLAILTRMEKMEAWVKAEPHEDYECLKRQFISLRSMVNSLGQQLSFYQKKSYETGEQHLSALKESLESERSMNAALTEELAALSSPQTPADLIDAARAVIARWDTPAWKESEPTADVINRLRRAADAVPPPQPDPRAEAMGMMVEALHMASEEVCSACCPSVWKTKDGYPGHSAECKAITEALSHPAVKPFIKGRG